MKDTPHTEYPSGTKRQWAWPLTIVIWIFWEPIHHSTSILCFVILLAVYSDESRFHHLLQHIGWMFHLLGHTVLKIWSQLLSTDACAHQITDMAPIPHCPSKLRIHLWWYDEPCHVILGYTSLSPLPIPIVWLLVDCYMWEEHELWQLNHLSMTNMDILRRLNRE